MRQARVKHNRLQIGDEVTISKMFFSNHGLRRSLVGKGEVLSTSFVCVRVRFVTHHIFIYLKAKGYIKSLVMPDKNTSIIEIHPVYLEKV